MNKKGQGLELGYIILAIVGVIVLAVVIYGFSVGWGNFFSTITSFGGGKVNVQTIVQACQTACGYSGTFDYCNKQRDVVFTAGSKAESLKCKELENRNVGLTPCDTVTCEPVKCNDPKIGGTWFTSPCDPKTQKDVTNLVTDTSDKQYNAYCCATNQVQKPLA